MMQRLSRKFYLRDTLKVAQDLLGKYLVREYQGQVIAGRIIETEVYIGATDKACHAYNGKKTPRTKALYEQGGTSYVYFIYGMYNCMNVVAEPKGTAAAVLIRGVELIKGQELAAKLRYGKELADLTSYQRKNFSNGPGKLCKAMAITREQNKLDLCGRELYITEPAKGDDTRFKICTSPRIGIDYAEEAKDFLWRYYIG